MSNIDAKFSIWDFGTILVVLFKGGGGGGGGNGAWL